MSTKAPLKLTGTISFMRIGTAARIMKLPAPLKNLKARNIPILTLPVMTAPEITSSMQETAQPHLRPHLSAIHGSVKVPITPPVWKSPLVVDIRSVPFERVSSFMYLMKDG